ncbi:MAG: hypothetical protein IPF46_07465 [Saprospiraceae bacterium]|nr:hypothetical protein [Candidatus Vicinibacter affinis]MBK6573542.1 hypothetical protein [Candidatus Vicinibacter affinis]MBK6821995.1 hypothetical protein [Candidatus Vicinibacter affinis]MBK8641365.1 hypothetical protein [Candidatus Vicinibacter affinis]
MRKCKNCSYKLMPQDPDQCPQCGSTEISNDLTPITPTLAGLKTLDEEMHTSKGKVQDLDSGIKQTEIGKQSYSTKETFPDQSNCPSCGYLLSRLSKRCPNCNKSIIDPTPTLVDLSQNKTQSLSEIIRSGANNEKVQLELSPLDPDDQPIKLKIIEGGQKVLGRAEIDPADESISQHNHVRFSYDGQNWKLENLSSNKAVFKMVTGLEELKEGDILILGRNKYYKVQIRK